MNRRESEFDGTLYPADEGELVRVLEALLRDSLDPDRVRTVVQGAFIPHGPLLVAGECAARTLATIDLPDTVLLVCPILASPARREGGSQPAAAVSPAPAWGTPLGDVPAVPSLAAALTVCPEIVADGAPFVGDYAAESVLPMMQMLNRNLRVCVLGVVATADASQCRAIGQAIAGAVASDSNGETLVVCSTDVVRGQPLAAIERCADLVLEKMEAFDGDGVLEVVAEQRLVMAGAAAVAATLAAMSELGCDELRVIHQTDTGRSLDDDEGECDALASGCML